MHDHKKAEHGYMVLADISGFDAYISDVELEHAHGAMQELMEMLVEQLSPPLTLASVEGDAVLAYAPAESIGRGETLLELTESAYVAFRERLDTMHRNTTCDCRACLTIPSLDLKFLVHFGEYMPQSMESGIALGGLDAQLVRERLLKDQMNGTGERAYALFTESSLEHMAVRPEGMAPHIGSYPHVGEVNSASLDLQARYDELTQARTAYVTPDEADLVIGHEFDAPPAVVWDWLNDPRKRSRWTQVGTWSAALRPGGRTGIGASNHCAHGVGTLIETVRDWRPYDYYTVEYDQWSKSMWMTITYQLEPMAGQKRTRLHIYGKVVRTPFWMGRGMLKTVFARIYGNRMAKMASLMAQGSEAAKEEQPSLAG